MVRMLALLLLLCLLLLLFLLVFLMLIILDCSSQNGQNVSPFASSLSSASSVSTGLPYVNYTRLQQLLRNSVSTVASALMTAFTADKVKSTSYKDMFKTIQSTYTLRGSFRYVLTARLLTSLGYGNFEGYSNFDVIARLKQYVNGNISPVWNSTAFMNSSYGFGTTPVFKDSPNLSVFPLLAYHRIVNDFYKYRQWQPLEPWTFNIDYITPNSTMSLDNSIKDDILYSGTSSLFDMEFSNLPLDYFLGVLPSPQFGEESSVSIMSNSATQLSVTGTVGMQRNDITTPSHVYQTNDSTIASGALTASNTGQFSVNGKPAYLDVRHTHGLNNASASLPKGVELGDLRISELRNALALQKYKEIQNANDSDFVSQVLAHFGVKPSTTQMKSRFITGGDSVLQINPEVNNNLVDGSADIKATVTGQLKCSGSFTADTFGVVIGIYRCTPVLDYAHIGIDRNLFKTDATDFPIPEFDSVGMQTQFACEIAAPSFADGLFESMTQKTFSLSRTYGYLPRYAELKTSFDRFEGAFSDSLRSWVSGLDVARLHKLAYHVPSTSAPVQVDMQNLLKCSPDLVADLFENTLSSTSNDDKLLVGSVNTAVIVRPYSVYGLPYAN
nr:MAG TPA: Major capsid protein [Microviridae sp.]